MLRWASNERSDGGVPFCDWCRMIPRRRTAMWGEWKEGDNAGWNFQRLKVAQSHHVRLNGRNIQPLWAEVGHKESHFLCRHRRWGRWCVPILNLPAMCTAWMPKSNSTMKSLSSAVGVIQADYWHRGGWHAIDCSVLSLGRSFSSHNGREKAPHPHDPDASVFWPKSVTLIHKHS